MITDIHVHIGGAGHGGTGCFFAASLQKRLSFRILERILGISEEMRQQALDQALKAHLFRALDEAEGLDRAVVLAYDRIFTKEGREDPRTGFYVPNDYVLQLKAEHRKILFGASIHPDRPGALQELDRCLEAGAVLLKWLPSNQLIYPDARRYQPFYRKMAAANLPLLVHTGSEFIFPVHDFSLNHPKCLLLPLEEGVTVIAAHAATSSVRIVQNYSEDLLMLMHRYSNLFADTSALCSLRGIGVLKRFREEGLLDRLVHGSDYPVPPAPYAFALAGDLSLRDGVRLRQIANPFQRDIEAKRRLGYPADSFTRADRLLRS